MAGKMQYNTDEIIADILIKKHLDKYMMEKDILIEKDSHSVRISGKYNNPNDPWNGILCIIMAEKDDKYISNLDNIKEMITKRSNSYVDFVIAGYDMNGIFNDDVFDSHISQIQKHISTWKWGGRPQVILLNYEIMPYANSEINVVFDYSNILRIRVDDLVEKGVVCQFSEVINPIITYGRKGIGVIRSYFWGLCAKKQLKETTIKLAVEVIKEGCKIIIERFFDSIR